MTSDWSVWVFRLSIYIFCMCPRLLQPSIACMFGGVCMCVGGVIIGVIGDWGGKLLCVVDVLAGRVGG